MSFSGENAYEFTKKIAFPRLIGSDGWKKANQMIKDEFKKFGYEVQVHKFKSSLYITNFLLRILMLPIIAVIIAIVWGYFIFPWISLIFSIIIICLVPVIGKFATTGTDYKPPKKGIDSENIYAQLKSNKSKICIIFMGHYDTKSQILSIVQRVFCYVLLFIGGIILCILALLGSIFKLFFYQDNFVISIIIIVLGIISCIAALLLTANAVQNKSPGALDNGTAVATILELSRIFKEKPPNNIDLIFLCTDAEEQGVLGASAYIKKFGNNFDKNSTYFINFEAPGAKDGKFGILTSYGMPKKIYTSKKLNSLAFKAAETLNIDLNKQYWPIGLLADHNPIINHGFEATMLGSFAISGGVHTKKDDISKVSKENLEIAGRLVEKMIEIFDNELE